MGRCRQQIKSACNVSAKRAMQIFVKRGEAPYSDRVSETSADIPEETRIRVTAMGIWRWNVLVSGLGWSGNSENEESAGGGEVEGQGLADWGWWWWQFCVTGETVGYTGMTSDCNGHSASHPFV